MTSAVLTLCTHIGRYSPYGTQTKADFDRLIRENEALRQSLDRQVAETERWKQLSHGLEDDNKRVWSGLNIIRMENIHLRQKLAGAR